MEEKFEEYFNDKNYQKWVQENKPFLGMYNFLGSLQLTYARYQEFLELFKACQKQAFIAGAKIWEC